MVLLRELDAFQFLAGLFPKSQHVLHGVAVFPLEFVDQVQPLFDLVQLGVVALVVLQTGGKLPREVLDGVVQVQQLAGGVGQAAVQLGRRVDGVGRLPQQVHPAGGLVPAREGGVGPCDLFPDGRGIGQHLAPALQRLLFPGGQGRVVDLVHLILEQVGLAALFFLIGDEAVQLPLDPDQLFVDLVIVLVDLPVPGVIVQNALVVGGVEQADRVVLPVDVDEPAAQFPQDSGGGRHPVDAAAALALGGDLPGQQQLVAALIARLFQAVLDGGGHLLEGRPDHRLGGAGADQLTGSAAAQNGIDGVDQDRLAGAGLAGQDVQSLFKVDVGLLDDGHIFDLQAAQHDLSLVFSYLRVI